MGAVWWIVYGLVFLPKAKIGVAIGILIIFSLISAGPYAVFGWLKGWLERKGTPLRPIQSAAILTVLVIGIPQVLPGNLAHSQYRNPLMIQVLDIGGVPFLLFLINWVNMLLAEGIYPWKYPNPGFKRLSAILISGCIVVGMAAYGKWRLHEFQDDLGGKSHIKRAIKIAGIQANIPVRSGRPLFVYPKDRHNSIQTALKLTKEVMQKTPDVDLVVWPEFPVAFSVSESRYDLQTLARITAELNVPIITAGYERAPGDAGDRYYNTAFLVNPNGHIEDQYRKNILLPFGEYVPLADRFAWIKKMFPQGYSYTPSNTINTLMVKNTRIALLLCYEAVFPSFVRKMVLQRADVLLILVDDAWFGWGYAAHIHTALGVYRAVEFRRPLLRIANAGITIFVTATGSIIPGTELGLYRTGAVTASVLIEPVSTVYTRYPYGVLLILLGIALTPGIILVKSFSRKKRNEDNADEPTN